MGYIGNKPAQTTIPADDSVTSAMIVDGTITSSDMAVDPRNASNLNAGDVPLAQLDNAPATDLTPLQNDIAVLALHSAVQNNQTAHNLSNAFIDQYEDDTGLDVETTTDRHASEYIWAAATGDIYTWHGGADGTNTGASVTFSEYGASSLTSSKLQDGATVVGSGDYGVYWAGAAGKVGIDFGTAKTIDLIKFFSMNTNARPNAFYLFHNDTASSGSSLSNTGHTYIFPNTASPVAIDSNTTVGSGATAFNASNADVWHGCSFDTAVTGSHRVWAIEHSSWYNNGNDNSGIGEIMMREKTAGMLQQASGNYTSTTQTAKSTVSKMGIVILYKNESGTATLDTDLVAQVSADGGANYVSAPLTAGGTFSAGILIAESNDITISNTGTTPKFKISFANQASGSKETRVYGAALLY